MGFDAGECWRRTDRSSWFGHQSRFVCGRRSAFGWGDGISGFSLSLAVRGASLSGTWVPLHFSVASLTLLVAGPGAGGTASPVDDLGLVDVVARPVGGGQARARTDRAVDVDDD